MKKNIIVITLFLTAMSSILFAQIPNPCFDSWSSGDPVGWATKNSVYPGSTTQSSNAYTGCTSAAELNSYNTGSGYYGGFLQTNKLTDGYFANAGNPAALNGWYILNSVGGDKLSVDIETKTTSTINGTRAIYITTSTLVYKQFSTCINYTPGTADSASIQFSLVNSSGGTSGTNNGSYAIIDDLSWGTCITGVEEISKNVRLEFVYPNPASDICNIIYSIPNSAAVSVSLFDLSGKKVMNILEICQQTSGRYKIPVDVRKLANGVYTYTITVDGLPYTQKLVISK